MVGVLLERTEHTDARLAVFAEVLDHLLGMHFAADVLFDVDVEHVVRGRDLGLLMLFHARLAHQLVALDAFRFCLERERDYLQVFIGVSC